MAGALSAVAMPPGGCAQDAAGWNGTVCPKSPVLGRSGCCVPCAELAPRHVVYLQHNPQMWADRKVKACVGSFTVRFSSILPPGGTRASLLAPSSHCGDVCAHSQPSWWSSTLSTHGAAPTPIPLRIEDILSVLPLNIFTQSLRARAFRSEPAPYHTELTAPHVARTQPRPEPVFRASPSGPTRRPCPRRLPQPRLLFGFKPG